MKNDFFSSIKLGVHDANFQSLKKVCYVDYILIKNIFMVNV